MGRGAGGGAGGVGVSGVLTYAQQTDPDGGGVQELGITTDPIVPGIVGQPGPGAHAYVVPDSVGGGVPVVTTAGWGSIVTAVEIRFVEIVLSNKYDPRAIKSPMTDRKMQSLATCFAATEGDPIIRSPHRTSMSTARSPAIPISIRNIPVIML
jgi:hypothetical protein